MSKQMDVAVVGEIYVDHIFDSFEHWPAPGEEVCTERYTREIGGGAANTACGLGRLGRRVRLIGLVGEDDAPWLGQRLRTHGVASDGVTVRPGASGITVSLSTRQDRSFFTHLGVNRALPERLAMPEVIDTLASARHVHFALPLPRTVATTLLPLLREAGCTTSLDVGFQPDWLGDPGNHATCATVDCLLPNEKEAARLCGAATVEAYFAFANTIGLRQRVLKLGARGSAGADAGVRVHVDVPPVRALDTTGAGDAFDTGYIDAWLDGADLRERLRRGCICGALSTQAAGALTALPDRSTLNMTHEQTYGS